MPMDSETPIIGSAMTAWNDALAAYNKMPMLFWISAVIMAVLGLVYFSLLFMVGPGFVGGVVALIYAIAEGFFLTPLAIAVHRFVLLGEVGDSYRLDPQTPRFQKFFTFLAALSFISAIPQLLGHALGPSFLGALIVLILSIAVAIIATQNVILFPSVAVDAPGADWRNAMADTKGHSWRVFFILVCVVLPLAIVGAILGTIFAIIPFIGWIFLFVIEAALSVAIIAAAAAAASRLYAAYANQLGRPSGLPAGAATGTRY
jgi:hypothetical protein